MTEAETMRVVPSGKIYRQMFDAQVQLSRSLTKIQRGTTGTTGTLTHGNTTIPVVHLSGSDVDHGILVERQKTWVDGFPNDPYVENPVVYKQYAEFINTHLKESESSVASREVRGLPDTLEPAKTGSDIIERISVSRKARHESAVEEMHQELSVINTDLEPRVSELCETLLRRLGEDDQEIASTLARIEKDDDLLTYTLDGLNKLWDEVQGHTLSRREWIEELDKSLSKTEDDRMEMIREVFKNYALMLEKIAHLMSPDLHRFLDKESQLVNQTVLSNRRAYGDLYVRLMSSDIEREKTQHTQWKRRVDDWRMLNTELAVQRFRTFMQGDKIVNPPGVQNVMSMMVAEQEKLSVRRMDLINQLMDLQPPSSTKTSVYHWNKGIQDISQEIDSVSQIHLSSLHKEYEAVCQSCLEEIEVIKSTLIDSGVCTETRAKTVVEEFMIPMVGERQRVYENTLESMEKALEEQNKTTTEKLKSLFKYAQAAAHVWDVHEIGLARQERALQEKLESCRQQHDNQNQEKEAHLDIIMDRMRQEATEKGLKDSLTKSLEMLDKIRTAYEVFHEDQTKIVKQYPDMVRQELTNYDAAVLKLFMVDRNHPEQESKVKKKPPPRPSRAQKDAAKDLPTAVSEILSTAKGTTFYVLTVAGEHGIPPEKEKTSQKKDDGATTFMTEVEVPEDKRPAYIVSIEVTDDALLEIKKKIRMNFLDHLEEWTDQATERSNSVVVAKCEELNSELDLRLHLHKPRARRAEFDVHNVRAAELVMHSERVTRHCKGIVQMLSEVRQHFQNMTQEHNQLAIKFRQSIEAMETVFINATKSSKLVALQSQLGVELDKFMSVIRASLRQFRRHLDETLQMLRESNAKFIKSFKIFSDGGNFCPEEIDDYRKRLDKMSQKVDGVEGSIMSELEDMERKRLDQATKVAGEFEDKFKGHMFDLIFMERIARWLTNTQVKIKAEVANSNSQAQQLGQHLSDLDRRVDACERPNLDKEQITSRQLNDTLKMIFDAFHARSLYLNMVKQLVMHRPSSATLVGNPALGARVGFVSELAPTPISVAGKRPTEDPSVNVIRSIFKTQKSKMRFGMDADLDGEYGVLSAALAIQFVSRMRRASVRRHSLFSGPNLTSDPDPIPLKVILSTASTCQSTDRDKMKSSMSNNTSSEKGKLSRRGVSPVPGEGPRKAQSAAGSVSTRVDGSRRTSKPAKFEKKMVMFGGVPDEDETGNEEYFLGIIRRILRDTLDGLLTTAELYYKQKGNRPSTRPQALQENYDQCADVISQKLLSYYQQADEYHNQCLQEFRSQLTRLEKSVSHVPSLLVDDITNEEIDKAQTERKSLEAKFANSLKSLETKREDHKHLLRPTLGHPHQVNQLSALCEKETERHDAYLAAVEEHTKNLQDCVVGHAKAFLEVLARTSETELLMFDQMLVVDDIEKGRVEAKKYPTTELIRRRNAGEPLEDDEDKDALPRGKNSWQGVPNNELVVGDKPQKQQLTASVTTAKTTLGHSATVTARDKAYQKYKAQFENTLQQIEDERQRLLLAEQRWMDSWNTSVEKVKQLY